MSDKGWTSYFERIATGNYKACIETAMNNGHTVEESEDCNNGSLNCPDCPFKGQLVVKNDFR